MGKEEKGINRLDKPKTNNMTGHWNSIIFKCSKCMLSKQSDLKSYVQVR